MVITINLAFQQVKTRFDSLRQRQLISSFKNENGFRVESVR